VQVVKIFPNEGVLKLQTYLQTYIKVSLLVYGHPKMYLTPKKELKTEGYYLLIQNKCDISCWLARTYAV
jgi:poly(3-hydroxyalkanoate) synthetase